MGWGGRRGRVGYLRQLGRKHLADIYYGYINWCEVEGSVGGGKQHVSQSIVSTLAVVARVVR